MSVVEGEWRWLWFWLLAALVAHRVHGVSGRRRTVARPTLECTCRSDEKGPDLGCRLASSFDIRPSGGGERKQAKVFSCDQDRPAIGGSDGSAWEALSTGTYRLHRKPLSWEEARQTCERLNAQLVELSGDKDDSGELFRAFSNARPVGSAARDDHVWVGIRHYAADANGNAPNFYTVRGQPATGLHWAQGEPNQSGKNEQCVSIRKGFGLYDSPCNWKLMFFCKHLSFS